MPVNPGVHYLKAKEEYEQATTDETRLACLKKMLSLCPKHKSSENLQKEIKTKIAKIKYSTQKQKELKKGSYQKISFKQEGAATICLVGKTNTGKSTLLKELTNANVTIASYPFTTKKPEFGILDYEGIKLQIVEIPAITENFSESDLGPSLLAIIKESDLIIFMFNTPSEKSLLDRELNEVKVKKIIYIEKENIREKIWKNLNLIKAYTKEPGKPKAHPPVALEKGSIVRDLGLKVHKDFIKNFDYAVVNGPSAKFKNMRCGLKHKLKDNDIVEFHIKK
ncbi:MAG: 50S ribosome-binding GTPase [Nanoarchaeota archaeon]|nr:50S ribosome-binding GTPase [Nanoarchaeota archaeon]